MSRNRLASQLDANVTGSFAGIFKIIHINHNNLGCAHKAIACAKMSGFLTVCLTFVHKC